MSTVPSIAWMPQATERIPSCYTQPALRGVRQVLQTLLQSVTPLLYLKNASQDFGSLSTELSRPALTAAGRIGVQCSCS